jgi:hypothetical protein
MTFQNKHGLLELIEIEIAPINKRGYWSIELDEYPSGM